MENKEEVKKGRPIDEPYHNCENPILEYVERPSDTRPYWRRCEYCKNCQNQKRIDSKWVNFWLSQIGKVNTVKIRLNEKDDIEKIHKSIRQTMTDSKNTTWTIEKYKKYNTILLLSVSNMDVFELQRKKMVKDLKGEINSKTEEYEKNYDSNYNLHISVNAESIYKEVKEICYQEGISLRYKHWIMQIPERIIFQNNTIGKAKEIIKENNMGILSRHNELKNHIGLSRYGWDI